MRRDGTPHRSRFRSLTGWAVTVTAVIGWGELLFRGGDLITVMFLICLTAFGLVFDSQVRWKVHALAFAAVLLPAVFLVASVPLGGSYRFILETSALKAIQTIHTAQAQYKSRYGRFATSLVELGPPVSGAARAAAADLIGHDLASGEKNGYKFILTGNPDGYTINANPATYGPSSGTRTFYSDQTMVVHENYGPAPATANSKELK